ncbi:MAG TPA: hypothetical protein VIL86_17890 [Tepidisphaeraceae bacterium]|jgi:hypothetical protein
MRNLPKIELMKRAVRASICPQCYQRPPGTECQDPACKRVCEARCTIFKYLPRLTRIARNAGDAPGAVQSAVREGICANCTLAPDGRDFCANELTRTCPLSRYAANVVDLLDHVLPGKKPRA